jgi:hypothetical protein
MMPKSAKRFSDDIMLSLIRIDHVHDFGSIRSRIVVIYALSGKTKRRQKATLSQHARLPIAR